MKKILYLGFTLIAAALVSCNSGKTSDTKPQIEPDAAFMGNSGTYDMTQVNKNFIIETMKVYQNVDVEEFKEGMAELLNSIEDPGSLAATQEEWYLNNISHIDSVSNKVVELANMEKYEDVARLMDSELVNFYSHPNSDTYTVYQLHWMMFPLYPLIMPDKQAYYQKLLEMWEINRYLMEGQHVRSGEIHPYYLRMMGELSTLYGNVGDETKKKEVDNIIATLSALQNQNQ